jgi:hypothetical protein
VFNTLIGNADMHLKNWSLIYPDRRNAALAPAYDVVSTIAYIPEEFAAIKYVRTKKMSELLLDELDTSPRKLDFLKSRSSILRRKRLPAFRMNGATPNQLFRLVRTLQTQLTSISRLFNSSRIIDQSRQTPPADAIAVGAAPCRAENDTRGAPEPFAPRRLQAPADHAR